MVFVREFRPHLFVTRDRAGNRAKIVFVSFDRTPDNGRTKAAGHWRRHPTSRRRQWPPLTVAGGGY